MTTPTAIAVVCSVTCCGRSGPLRRGLCNAHYQRVRRTGDPQPNEPVKTPTLACCSGPGCTRWAARCGLCRTHAVQLDRGRPLTPIRPRPQARRNMRAVDVIVEVEHLAGTDTPVSIAGRLGYRNARTLAKVLARAQRGDLARTFWAAA